MVLLKVHARSADVAAQATEAGWPAGAGAESRSARAAAPAWPP